MLCLDRKAIGDNNSLHRESVFTTGNRLVCQKSSLLYPILIDRQLGKISTQLSFPLAPHLGSHLAYSHPLHLQRRLGNCIANSEEWLKRAINQYSREISAYFELDRRGTRGTLQSEPR